MGKIKSETHQHQSKRLVEIGREGCKGAVGGDALRKTDRNSCG